jgi:hypothetical protein
MYRESFQRLRLLDRPASLVRSLLCDNEKEASAWGVIRSLSCQRSEMRQAPHGHGRSDCGSNRVGCMLTITLDSKDANLISVVIETGAGVSKGAARQDP